MCSSFVPARLRWIDLPDDVLWKLWLVEIKMRFLEGLQARRRAAIVIQNAWQLRSWPGLVEHDEVVAINPWMVLAVLSNVEMDEIPGWYFLEEVD